MWTSAPKLALWDVMQLQHPMRQHLCSLTTVHNSLLPKSTCIYGGVKQPLWCALSVSALRENPIVLSGSHHGCAVSVVQFLLVLTNIHRRGKSAPFSGREWAFYLGSATGPIERCQELWTLSPLLESSSNLPWNLHLPHISMTSYNKCLVFVVIWMKITPNRLIDLVTGEQHYLKRFGGVALLEEVCH